MRPVRRAFWSAKELPEGYDSYYTNRKGTLFGVKRIPEAGEIFLGVLRIGARGSAYVGQAQLIPLRRKKEVYIDFVTRFEREIASEFEPKSTTHIQLFRAVIEEAIKEARTRKWHKVTLICEPALVSFYERFGFRRDWLSYLGVPSMTLDISPAKPYLRWWRRLVDRL